MQICDAPKSRGLLTNCQLVEIPVDIVGLDTTLFNTGIRLFSFNEHFMVFSKHITMSLITTSYKYILQTCLPNTFTKRLQSHNPTFFTISAPNESRLPVLALHLKCYPL